MFRILYKADVCGSVPSITSAWGLAVGSLLFTAAVNRDRLLQLASL